MATTNTDPGIQKIEFGTSGWRGVIGEDFTFENVRIAVQGIVNFIHGQGIETGGILVGYDTRFLSEKFAAEAAKVLAFNDFRAYVCNRDVPTPCIAFETIRRGLLGAINFTASHNPPEYNGLKFSTANGAPALNEVTHAIEKEIHALQSRNERLDIYDKKELIETIDPRERYLASLREKIDVDAIAKSGLRIAVDSLYGTARDYLDYFLLDTNIEIKSIHNYRDPYFGGYSPECDQKNLASLRRVVLTEKYDVGLATDCDADRFGIIDERDRFVSPNHILALLALYMKRNRGTEGGLARSVATTHLIDLIAREFDVPLYETPVGFKYIGQLILEDKLAFGGEESAGLGIRDHLPEKDGILACLLVAEMLATTRKTLTSLIDEMFHEFGPRFTKRIDLKLTPQLQERMVEKLKNPPKEIDGIKVAKVKKVDGVKLIFDEQRWLLFRLSGTEPVVRLYAEACTPKDLKALVDMGRKLVKG
jgi:phosphoglucomutase